MPATDDKVRLRADGAAIPFHVVLVEPEIPPNTGNIVRLCVATRSPLHLVGKLGFSIDEHAVRRAGVDTWPLAEVNTHTDLNAAEEHIRKRPGSEGARLWCFSAKATKSYLEADFKPGDALVFGKESVGLDPVLLQGREEYTLGIPTIGPVRSLNLANCAALGLYEALRQVGALERPTLRD